ncbi:MAG TPA: PAS domain S-box protein [Erysipelotrichaceae bacterium]|nr:PAS domain S-box protein [Erysipelotrichaceae bacterium]
MNFNTFVELLDNAEFLLILVVIYEFSSIFLRRFKKYHWLIRGFLIGLIGIAIMSVPYEFTSGLVFDTRSILLSATALIFSTGTLIVSAVIMILYRVYMGGVGALTGVLVITSTSIIGYFWKKYILNISDRHKWLNIYFFGVITHIGMLLCMFALPFETAINTLKELSIPVMLIYPFVTVFISMLLLSQITRDANAQKIIEAEQRYRNLFENKHTVMFIVDPETSTIIDANAAAVQTYGYTKDEFKRMSISTLNTLSPDEIKKAMQDSKDLRRNSFIFKHRRKDGSIMDVEVVSGPINFDKKIYLYSIVIDVTERVQALKALENSEKRFKVVVENAPDAIFIQSNKRFAFINNAALKLFNAESPEQLLYTWIMDRIHPDYRKSVEDRLYRLNTLKEDVEAVEEVFLTIDNKPIDVEAIAVPIVIDNTDGAMVFARDISERKQLERNKIEWDMKIQQQQKLEAIGTLAGGVAHEINNPINGIINYAQLIVDDTQSESSKKYAEAIIQESERISEIVRNLLQFSRQEKQSHSYASVYDIINRTISLMNSMLKKDQIILELNIDENLPETKCRSQQIQQVLMNLLTNAKDALNEKYPNFDENKKIILSCKFSEHDNRRWINLSVKDFGNGIPLENREKIFEPFFSTKPKNLGTGLGLSISHGIVHDHHGTIQIDTVEGQYCEFIVELPVDNGWEVIS